jgi:nickel/cobalt transporter (NicO) family protein
LSEQLLQWTGEVVHSNFTMLLLFEITIPQGLTLFSTLLFGFLLGLRHSLEPDHLAAVSTIVNDGKSFWRATLTGCLWGVGHTLSLLIVGGLVLLFKFDIGEALEKPFQILVAATLILLGLHAFWRLYRKTADAETESPHQHKSQSLVVGMIHGLAGSGTLTILISSAISPPSTAFFFLVIFGIGSIGGMTLASFFLTLPFRLTAFRFNSINYLLRGVAGAVSLAFGGWLIYGVING